MTTVLALGSRVRALRPLQRDALLAAVMTVALVVESGVQLDHSARPVLCVVLVCFMGASLVAVERAPTAAAAVAIVALALYVRLAEVPDWTLPLLVVAFELFAVGMAEYSMRELIWRGGVLIAGLFAVMAADVQDASIGVPALLASAALFGLLPLAVGRALHNRRLLARELRARTEQLRRDRDERARRAAGDERTRIARELHDVVAHSVSVMVIQAQGAQRVAEADERAAAEALQAIESAGRDALHEMRAMIGVMRGPDADAEESAPGLAQLPALAERARAAGLAVELALSPELPALPLGLDLIAYRIVQEALTNAIKHGGRTHASVAIRCVEGRLEIDVTDDGGGDDAGDGTGAGHGLMGMRERLALYGGELTAGPRAEGGFRVTATVALDAAPRQADRTFAPPRRSSARERARRLLRGPRFEVALGVGVAVVAAVDLLASHHRQGGVALNLLFAVLLGACVRFRRSNALLYAGATIGLAVLCTAIATDVRVFPLAFYVLLFPAYALAVYETLPRGLLGLATLTIGAATVGLVASRPARFGDFLFPVVVFVCTFTVGRALWGGRALAGELEQRNRRLAAEREDRARLAVADERTRVARQLQVVVTNEVSEMVLGAELAQRLLGADLAAARRAMVATEETGRAALTEMRRILGVLRGPNDAELEPQPGLGAIQGLVERARGDGQLVELSVEGEPGPLPASVELAAYRVVEESLAQRADHVTTRDALDIRFAFREHDLLLVISDDGRRAPPTVAIRERVAACHGELIDDAAGAGGHELRIVLPTDVSAVLA
jgi:signal transduction histidine kinase